MGDELQKEATKKKTILVVDDEPEAAEAISIRLQANGFNTMSAADGEEAIFKAEKYNPDLIIMDLAMPKLDGHESIRRLRLKEATATIPIMILTASREEDDVVKAAYNSTGVYVTKPFTSEKLLASVKRALEQKAI